MALSACSSDPDGAADPSNDAGVSARGTATCQDWQRSYCDWNTACQGPSVACEQVKSIYCRSDEDARRCAEAMASSSCNTLPSGCDVGVLADRDWARKACEDFAASFCRRIDACSTEAEEPCIDQVKGVLDCRRALGVTLAFEPCMSALPKMDCRTLAVPAACRGVLLLQ